MRWFAHGPSGGQAGATCGSRVTGNPIQARTRGRGSVLQDRWRTRKRGGKEEDPPDGIFDRAEFRCQGKRDIALYRYVVRRSGVDRLQRMQQGHRGLQGACLNGSGLGRDHALELEPAEEDRDAKSARGSRRARGRRGARDQILGRAAVWCGIQRVCGPKRGSARHHDG